MNNALATGTEHPAWIWRNGELHPWASATVHVTAVGHASVAGVFEGIKAYRSDDGERLLLFRLDDHLRRLRESARICRVDLPYDLEQLRHAVIELLRANGWRGDTYIRPWTFAEGLVRELMVAAGAPSEVIIDSWPFTTLLGTERGCRAAVSTWIRVGEASAPPRAKAFANYHHGRLALIEARTNGHDWPVLLNDRHQVSEGSAACIALVRDGVLITPSLSSSVLDSITRDTALRLCADLGVPVEQRMVDRSELYLADELFFLGTAWEILPITTIDGLPVGSGQMGPLAVALDREYSDIVRGRSTAHPEWLHELQLTMSTAP